MFIILIKILRLSKQFPGTFLESFLTTILLHEKSIFFKLIDSPERDF